MPYNAFITAGGRIHGEFAQSVGTEIKALIKINEKSILQRTIQALKNSENIGQVVLIAPEEVRNLPDAAGIDEFIPAHVSGSENILKGLQRFEDDSHVILCSSDLPFINTAAVDDFIRRCPGDAAIGYPIFEREEINPAIRPGVPSYVKLKDGHFTGGSMFRLSPKVLIPKMKELTASFNARKSTLAMAKIMGWRILAKMVFGVCKIDDILHRAEEIMGGRCVAVRGCDPAITIDVDDERSYRFSVEYAKRELA